MPPKFDQATVLILDIGRNVAASDEKGGKSFFDEARSFTMKLIERKIVSQMKTLVGIILLGSKKTKNAMATEYEGSFRHIELLSELQPPTWQMIRDLPDTTSKSKGDWFDAIVVAADHFKNGVYGVKIITKKIILMTNFEVPCTNSDIDQALNGLKEDNFEIDVIGPDLYDETLKNEDIALARRFVETTDGATATFDYAMKYLLFHKKRAVNALPWNVDLTIGPHLKIPVSAYIRTNDEPVVKNWQKSVKDPVTMMASTNEAIVHKKVHVNTENQQPVEPTNVTKGYVYGQQIVPFDNCDKAMLYQSGEKSLSVYGFTHVSSIHWNNLNGVGLSYVFGRKNDSKAQFAIRCLVECLLELKLVGIVRRVYNNGNAPKMYALMPVIDNNNYVCLSMAQLCYKEDIKHMAFPNTNSKKYQCNEEQVNAFIDLIKAMDLTKAYDETFDEAEAFPIAETVSPSAQYILDSIAFRAMNPGKPLPPPRDDIMMLFKTPPSIEKKSREPLDKLKKLFTLEKVEVKKRRPTTQYNPQVSDAAFNSSDNTNASENITKMNNEILKIQIPLAGKTEVTSIGTVEPINDFQILTSKGKTLYELSPEMIKVIESLFYCNLDGTYTKALETMKFFRDECVKKDPAPYNDWLKTFKIGVTERKKDSILNLFNDHKINYIIKEENSLSNLKKEDNPEDSQIYENDTIPNSCQLKIDSEFNDLFDD